MTSSRTVNSVEGVRESFVSPNSFSVPLLELSSEGASNVTQAFTEKKNCYTIDESFEVQFSELKINYKKEKTTTNTYLTES